MRNHTARAKQMKGTTSYQPSLVDVLCKALDDAGVDYTVTTTPHTLNAIFGVVGLIGVWFTTHNLWAVFWACIAAVHIEWHVRKNKRKESHGTR